jgi:hypothetical protein
MAIPLVPIALGAAALLLLKGGGGSAPLPQVAPIVTPPGPPDPSNASALAPQVADDVRSKGMSYDHNLVRSFQNAANIMVDGLYGPVTAGAVQYYTGGQQPPAPLYSDAKGFRGVTPYTP